VPFPLGISIHLLLFIHSREQQNIALFRNKVLMTIASIRVPHAVNLSVIFTIIRKQLKCVPAFHICQEVSPDLSVTHDISGFAGHRLSGLIYLSIEAPDETDRDATGNPGDVI
jgi:hypothetical protein